MSINIAHRGRIHVADHGMAWEWFTSCMQKSPIAPYCDPDEAEVKQAAESDRDLDWHTWQVNYEKLWEGNGTSKLLKSLDIACDGGLNSRDVDKLWNSEWYLVLARYWGAAQMTICIAANIAWLVYADLRILMHKHSQREGDKFLVGRVFWEFLMTDIFQFTDLIGAQMVVGVELCLIMLMVSSYALNILMAFCYYKRPCDRWISIALLFWRHLPKMATFTAMKLLHYVDPWVLMHELFLEISFFSERLRHGRWRLALWKLLRYIFSRFVCFVVGLDAFLVKFRETSEDYISKSELTIGTFVGSTIFLFQVLGMVNLSAVVRNRVFFFVFGGPQCTITTLDKAKEWYWNARLAHKIWETHGVWKFLIIMLSFSDCDIQFLLLQRVATTRSDAID